MMEESLLDFKKLVLLECVFMYFSGDITRKGYDKKRSRLLNPYVNKSPPQQTSGKLM